jgi:L-asparaginase II
MLRCGLDLDDELLALAAGSHSGEDFHVEGTEKILAGAGLVADDLRCPESWPIDPEAQQAVARDGGGPSRVRMNCSGKHAAMLATCVAAGWPIETYLDPEHPLQLAVRGVVEELSGEAVPAVGIDGCGAPLFAVSTAGVARAFRALVLAGAGTPERRVADAMRTHPQWTSGTRREERQLMDAVPGLLVKCGAEGVDAFAFADGRAGAVKIDDGAMRARTPVTVALLRALGLGEVAALDELAVVQVRGGDGVVGAVRPAPEVF